MELFFILFCVMVTLGYMWIETRIIRPKHWDASDTCTRCWGYHDTDDQCR